MVSPVVAKEQLPLRRRVYALIRNGYRFPSKSNIVFVCGGNDECQMRPQFTDYCKEKDFPFLVFLPEYAMEHLYAFMETAFSLTEFESLIGELSQAIVIFPEAPGSFAEAGYFSAIKKLAMSSILVLDQDRLASDSFISLGPAKLINDATRFHPPIQFSYKAPQFDLILTRIQSRVGSLRHTAFPAQVYSEVGKYQKLLIAYALVEILQKCVLEDIEYLFKGLFSGEVDSSEVRQLIAILTGAELLLHSATTGEFSVSEAKGINFLIEDGYKEEKNSIGIEIARLNGGDLPIFPLEEEYAG